jgi:hypothetical protein
VAGAAIFTASLVCQQSTDVDELELVKTVSIATGAADATIKEVCKELYPYMDRILPPAYRGSDLSVLLH